MKYTVVKKPRSFMWPYIAVNGEMPKRERPVRMRNIGRHTILIREDICRNKERERRVLLHEYREMHQFEKHPGMSYRRAHRRAGY